MKAKDQLIDFLRTAPKADKGLYEFDFDSTSSKDVDDHIHRMRVELSRIRNVLRDRGKQLKSFKMIIVKKTLQLDKTKIVLQYREPDDKIMKELSEEISEVFDLIGDDLTNQVQESN